MNSTSPRLPTALGTAVQRVKVAVRDAAQRCVDALGVAALATAKTIDRDDLLAAQFEFSRKQSAFVMNFNERFDEAVAAELRRLESGARPLSSSKMGSSWQSLSLVDDREVELQVAGERTGRTIQQECEAELRELDVLVLGLLRPKAGPDVEIKNPLRPELIGKAMLGACDVVVDRPEVRVKLAEQLAKVLASKAADMYRTIAHDFTAAGVRALEMKARSTQGPGNELGQFTNTGYDTLGRPTGLDPQESLTGAPISGRQGLSGPIGSVDAGLMMLIRRLASFSQPTADTQFDATASQRGVASGSGVGLPNLILANRDELRRAATGSLDHMVIDVVGSLFDQILADPKIPPQMARHIARLQLPVLRAALGDPTFFSSRRHPVRRLVNRMASLAVAFDDFADGAGQHFLKLVRELVDEIVNGDFDQMQVYELTLDRLEQFVAEQARNDVETKTQATSLLDNKETELLLQQRYTHQLQTGLASVAMDDFVRQFLTQVWSQALMKAAATDGYDSERVQRFKVAARELIMSMQPKGSPIDRKNFLVRLPQLMKDLNEGIALIGWSDAGKKDFFGKLLPAHAASLKSSESMRTLDYNLLVRQIDAVLGMPLPRPGDAIRGASAVPVLDDVVSEPFTSEEAQRIGLVEEKSFDWSGEIDIDLGAGDEPEVTEVDIRLDGLPIPDPVEPTKGASLADHVQIGFSYRMHFEGAWHKVRLSHISPGRTFFVFTRGKHHQHAISMTARMLSRLCDTGRLRAFENAYLIERATARARKQLAALRGGSAGPSTSGAPLSRL